MKDKIIEQLIAEETIRQAEGVELIASENYVSEDVLKAMGSILTNKYAEGYPGHRYYGGCQIIDKVERLAIERLYELYKCTYANVQPHSGSQANRAVIEAVCKIGDTILSLALNDGGHLTHGASVSFSGKYYNVVNYHCKDSDGRIDYDEMLAKAREHMPKLIIAGASAYSREWDYDALLKAKSESLAAQAAAGIENPSCIIMFDMAHTAGPIAAGLLKNPCDYCDIVTSTTHKTLRGPRGGIILLKQDFEYEGKMMSKRIDSSIFPGNQGGPLENVIAAKAVCFYEALQPEFVGYQKQVIANAKTFAEEFIRRGYKVLTGGTDNHEFLIDLRSKFPEMTGQQATDYLQEIHITVNRNMLPDDTRKPSQCSGLRVGTPAVTTLGYKEDSMVRLAKDMDEYLTFRYQLEQERIAQNSALLQ